MKNFLVILRYKVPIEIVEAHTVAHRAYLKTLYETNEMLFSGPFVPREGGVLWIQAPNRERIEQIIANDPFELNGVANYEINEFAPTTFAPLLQPLFDSQKR